MGCIKSHYFQLAGPAHVVMTELNPGFTFDLGPGSVEVQTPWEFSGEVYVGSSRCALSHSRLSQSPPSSLG